MKTGVLTAPCEESSKPARAERSVWSNLKFKLRKTKEFRVQNQREELIEIRELAGHLRTSWLVRLVSLLFLCPPRIERTA
jgi:hypothetical protein